jgi:glycosyltransferase involved in cell wall biosynthesis
LTIIGRCPDSIKQKYESLKEVRFAGFVDDFKKALRENTVFLAPIAYGTGIKTKIVEAMALGLPVVTNSIGAEGLAVENGYHMFVEDDYQKLAGIFDRLHTDEILRKSIGHNARRLIKENYRWDKLWEGFGELGL